MICIQCDLLDPKGDVVATETPPFKTEWAGRYIRLVPAANGKVDFGPTPAPVTVAGAVIHHNVDKPIVVRCDPQVLSKDDSFVLTVTIDLTGEATSSIN